MHNSFLRYQPGKWILTVCPKDMDTTGSYVSSEEETRESAREDREVNLIMRFLFSEHPMPCSTLCAELKLRTRMFLGSMVAEPCWQLLCSV